MGIFTKKFDYEKDFLRLQFVLEYQRYVFYYGKEEVPYYLLNKKTKKKIDFENDQLLNHPQLLQKKVYAAKLGKRYEFLSSKGLDCEGFESFSKDDGNMSHEMKLYLDYLTAKENVVLGIHRIKKSSENDVIDMVISGLIMTGHSSSIIVENPIKLTDNVSVYADNKKIMKELTHADAYKSAIGSLLIEIPDADLDKNIYIVDDKGDIRLNPKYILGFVPIEDNHYIRRIITAEDFKNYGYCVDSKVDGKKLFFYQDESHYGDLYSYNKNLDISEKSRRL